MIDCYQAKVTREPEPIRALPGAAVEPEMTSPTSNPGDADDSRRSSVVSTSLGGRDRPRAPLGPRTHHRPGSMRTHYSVTPAPPATTSPPAAVAEPEAVPASSSGNPSEMTDEPMALSPTPITSPKASVVLGPVPEAIKSPPPALPPRRLPPLRSYQPLAPETATATASSPTSSAKPLLSPKTTSRTNVEVISAAQSEYSEAESLPGYNLDRYRSPEAVVEHIEDNDRSLPPGIVDATWDDKWDHNGSDKWEPKTGHPERPQIGPGRLPLRFLQDIHQHPLMRPEIINLPRLTKSPSASPRTSISSLDCVGPSIPGITIEDVWETLPGGSAQRGEWYFCAECFGWFHIIVGSGEAPEYRGYDSRIPRSRMHESDEDELQAWGTENSRLRDIHASRSTAPHSMSHFHKFERLLDLHGDVRIDRVSVDGLVETFTHFDPVYGVVPSQLVDLNVGRENRSDLHMSCSSDCWVVVQGPVGGQFPKAAAHEWTQEKRDNPGPGGDGIASAIEGWQLVLRLLQNPLFQDKRGWVKMSNPKFLETIGPSLRSSVMLHRIGFSCINENDGYQVGPFSVGELVTAEHVDRMFKYMLRTWVELTLYLQAFERSHGKPVNTNYISSSTVSEVLGPTLKLKNIPRAQMPWGKESYPALETLGVSAEDTMDTIDIAYDFQMSENSARSPVYFTALEQLSTVDRPDIDTLRIKVAMERSMDRFSLDDLEKAYARIGLDHAHLEDIMVDRKELPPDYIYDRHRETIQNATDSEQRTQISNALIMIGKDRGDWVMQDLGRAGGTHLSLEQAYREFNVTPDQPIDNEMLILQYESWIADRPSRMEHYRLALSLIANAPGQERPAIQAFLEGKDISEFQGPVRRDIPAGLRNIGNTCYLNSVLQFLYAVKPIRDAVLAFEQTPSEAPLEDEDTKATEKRIKIQSSCRFVEMLGELFKQMYETEQAAVTPAEELARLAILPIDLIDQRRDAVPSPKTRLTIDTLPTIPQLASPSASGVATTDTTPTTPISALSPTISSGGLSPRSRPSPPLRRGSVLGKRASEDRESTFGGSEERLRSSVHRSTNLIEMDSPTRGSPSARDVSRDEDVEMTSQESPTREGSDLSPADAGLSGLELTSPSNVMDGPATPKTETRISALLTPDATPPRQIGPQLPDEGMSMADALGSGPPPLPPRRRSLALVAAEKFGLQQDAAEILINVLSQLEYAFDNGEGGNLIQRLFSAKFRQQMLMDSGNGFTESHQPVESQFSHPIIGVEEDDKDLYDGLAELYLGGDEVDYEGKKGYKMDLLDELPPVLYILMRRSQYDFARNRQIKTNTYLKFGETLAMDRFLAGADSARREASITLTRKMMRMRARRHELRHHKPLSMPETFRFVRDALGDKLGTLLGDDAPAPEFLQGLGMQAEGAEEEIAQLSRDLVQCKETLEGMWAEARDVEYELVSVFVHGGTGTGGHYWTYQTAPGDDKYYYYSDDTVKDVPATDVFLDKSNQGVSPALLVYVRKAQGLVDTLHRRVAEEAAAEADAEDAREWSEPGKKGGEEVKESEQAKTGDKAMTREERASSSSPRVKFAVPAVTGPIWGAGEWLHG
ncbi:uncharacterized protein CcaverHIS019_0300400 [Cutaneotrichosporon cavernicola]|uniref:ubiquitinyl hydrolase 1 n=1 Tax=Cutaneotrichosporon cavernicola TaxID=279322 RepID=A0AA48IAB0_9TREE|nr:uncharacterized protein CcaverHIS019_0300400 [Cutaneotrichosporon cavernicola]BEI89970.1 hypothetical protein CcaverHIS019_0300400 [Cutaneotrichosporon cavernicola]